LVGETKIDKFDIEHVITEHVFWFDVTVRNFAFVEIFDRLNELTENLFDRIFVDKIIAVDHLDELTAIAELLYDEDVCFCLM
jgi:hypothetical protein